MFFGELVVIVEDLPGGSGEVARVFRVDAELRGVFDFGGDGVVKMGLFSGDVEFGDDFAGEGVPEEKFTAVGMGREGLAAGDEFFDFNHIEKL